MVGYHGDIGIRFTRIRDTEILSDTGIQGYTALQHKFKRVLVYSK